MADILLNRAVQQGAIEQGSEVHRVAERGIFMGYDALQQSDRDIYNRHVVRRLNAMEAYPCLYACSTHMKTDFIHKACFAAAIGFTGLLSMGAFVVGFTQDDGRALAFASLLAGITLAAALWTRYGGLRHGGGVFNWFMVPAFCLTAGLALYSNVSYLLWGVGYPMAIRAIETGAMQGHSWLPPLTLFWAVLCWCSIDKNKRG